MALRTAIVAAGLLLESARAITLEGFLAAPRRGNAILNPTGEIALFSSQTFNWTTHKAATRWYALDVASGNISEPIFGSAGGDISEVVWVGATNKSILYINGTNDNVPGGVTLWTADLGAEDSSRTLVASLNAPFTGLKAVKTGSGSINFVANTLAYWNNGSAYNPKLASTPLSSAQLYDSNYVRHWQTYISEQRYSVFSGVLAASNGTGYSFDGKITNLLSGITDFVTKPETPVQYANSPSDYDISPDGSKVAFLTKAPELPKANYTASYIYVVPHDGSAAPFAVNGPGSTAPEAAQGASKAPKWSPDSKKLAYAQQDGVYYESDRFKLYVATVEGKGATVTPIAEDWDSSPSSVQWAASGKDLWVSSELHASVRLWTLPADASASFKPANITGPNTTLADFALLPSGGALISAASSWTSRIFYTAGVNRTANTLFSAHIVDPELVDVSPSRVSNFWYLGGDGTDLIQAFQYVPPDFDPSKKYPVIVLVHGGPQSTLGDNWSRSWNYQLWAQYGFVVVVPQFTGSTSYGQAFTDKIWNNWGGTPYRDIEKLFEHLEKNVSYVDTDRAVAAGSSFGAFMINWIQGHSLGRKFKALVTHAGKVNQFGAYATDEIWFIQHDQNGTIWDNRENYAIWDPLIHSKNFSTPQFVIHNDLDYRVVQAEGMLQFNVLQGRGVPSRFLHFIDEGHGVSKRENVLLWNKYILNWLRYWVGLDDELITEDVIKQ